MTTERSSTCTRLAVGAPGRKPLHILTLSEVAPASAARTVMRVRASIAASEAFCAAAAGGLAGSTPFSAAAKQALNDLDNVPAKHDHGAERGRTVDHHAKSQSAFVHAEQRLADFKVSGTADR